MNLWEDITLNDGKVITCRLDNLVKRENIYTIIDAKSSIVNNLSTNSVDELISKYATTNQQSFYDALKNGKVKNIKPRGENAKEYFGGLGEKIPDNLPIGNQIEFLVNDVATEEYKIYNKILKF